MHNQLGPVTIADIRSLAMLPKTLHFISRVDYQDDAMFKQVFKAIEVDQALTANVLFWANCAWSGPLQPIGSVRDAVLRMGMKNVLNLTLLMSLSTTMRRACPGYDLVENELARHSMAAFFTVLSFEEFKKQDVLGHVATAALLHDLGKLILERYITPAAKIKIQALREEMDYSLVQAETKALGTNHAEVGGAIGELWRFPEELITLIMQPHEEQEFISGELDLVQFADLIAKNKS